jgi:hypothetical protein
MKTKLFLTAMLAMVLALSATAQVPTLHDQSITPTITDQQIKELGQNHIENRSTIVLDFEGLGSADPISNFYNGGTSGQGFSGTNYGVEFSTNALASISNLSGGGGNFSNNPSGVTVLFFLTGQPYMNVPAGFSTGLSFYYSAYQYNGSLQLFDGLDGTGNLLASVTLPANGTNPALPNRYNIWDPVSVPFNGVAKSVVFGGVENQIGFDDVTFGSLTPGGGDPIPVPISNWALYIGILLMLTFIVIRFRRMI